MGTMEPLSEPLSFHVPLAVSTESGGWTVALLPGSADSLGTRRSVGVEGEIDGHPFVATLLPHGGGVHMLPIKATLRSAVAKGDGAQVHVVITSRRMAGTSR